MFATDIARSSNGQLLARVHTLNVRRPTSQVPQAIDRELAAIASDLQNRYDRQAVHQIKQALARRRF